MKPVVYLKLLCILTFSAFLTGTASSQAVKDDMPEPKVVTPGKKGKAPSDAIVLFTGGNLNHFESVAGGPAPWKVTGKKFTVVPGSKNIQTKQRFGDCQLHIEWKTPRKDVRMGKTGQKCGNSGIYFMGKYEIQVLNSYKNKTYYDGQAGALYSEYPPLVNASRKPGKWQVYDIIFKAPKYNSANEMTAPGYFTVIYNGVLVQNHIKILGPTTAHSNTYPLSEPELPLMLQDHKNKVSYRNIWIRKL